MEEIYDVFCDNLSKKASQIFYFKKMLAKNSNKIYNESINTKNKTKKKKGAIFMKVKIIGKELKITEAINDYVEKKLDRIDKYFEDAEADVTLKTEKNVQTAEICVITKGEKFRAVTEDKDLYASIDKDIDILEGQIRKSKTKRDKMMKDSSIKAMEVQPNVVEEISNEIIKTSYYEIKPITPEDAVLELQEHPTHNFLAFINVETGKVNVIHKLKDGKNYGLVEPEA